MYILYSQVLPVGITFHNPHSLYTAYLYSLFYMYTVSYLQIFNFLNYLPRDRYSFSHYLYPLLSEVYSFRLDLYPLSPYVYPLL